MKAKRYFGDSICPRRGRCHSRRPPAPPNDIPQADFLRVCMRTKISPAPIRTASRLSRAAASDSTAHSTPPSRAFRSATLCAMKAKRYFGDSICPRRGRCHSRRPPAPPNDIPQGKFSSAYTPAKNPPAPAKPHTEAMPSTAHISPRQTFARGCPRPRRPIRPRPLGRPTVPQAAKHRPTQGASAGAQAGRDWKICGGMAMHTPAFSKCNVQIT